MTAFRFRAAVLWALLLSLPAARAASQVFDASTSLSGIGTTPNACTQGYGSLGSQLVGDWALARIAWSGEVASSLAGSSTQQSSFQAELRSPEWRGMRLLGSTQRELGELTCGASASARQHSAAFSFSWQRSGASLRYQTRVRRETGGIPRDTLTERILGPTTRGISLAAWHHLGRALVAASLGSRSQWREQRETLVRSAGGIDTIPSDSGPIHIPRPGPSYETRMNRGLLHTFATELRLAWASRRLAFDASAGRALGGRALGTGRSWGRTSASVNLTPSIALVGGYVLDDGWETRQPSPRRYFTVGARLTSSPFSRPVDAAGSTTRAAVAAFRLQTSAQGVVTLGIRSASARLVEVTGDFVQWRPVRMLRVSADWWELRMPMEKGVHRVNVRVDGGTWNAPPGLPRQRDEFGGDAGVFVIP